MFFGGDNLGQDDDSGNERRPRSCYQSLHTSVSVLHSWKSSGSDSESPGHRELTASWAGLLSGVPSLNALQWFLLSIVAGGYRGSITYLSPAARAQGEHPPLPHSSQNRSSLGEVHVKMFSPTLLN